MARRAGEFKIPSQTIRVGNDSLRTPELTLNVTNAPSGRSATVAPASGNAMKPWAQLTLAKSQAYIGQPIEAQIEIGFDARMLVDPQSIQVGPEVVTPG
ncbi:MAG: hypothetical protein DMF18_10325, partial [Verrucomicrobia bacterium]